MKAPIQPKLYHIVHLDRLPSIISNQSLWCDAVMATHAELGTTIGMASIKRRRLEELTLDSYPGLHVGECVPFYFCPRSIMLYLLHMGNHQELTYRGGQALIVHLQADLHATVAWAAQQHRRWAFTLSNAGAYYFEDRADLTQLDEINWEAVQNDRWGGIGSIKEGKQAEFLVERDFPWHLVERIGVYSREMYQLVVSCLPVSGHRPLIEIKSDWYY